MASESCVGLIILYLSQLIGSSSQDSWITPPFLPPNSPDKAVQYDGYNDVIKQTNIYLEEEISRSVCIAQINYNGSIVPLVGDFNEGKNNFMLGVLLMKNANSQWGVYVTKKQDYETPTMRKYRFSIVIDTTSYAIALSIKNIDDNAPVIQPNERNCALKENYSGQTNCSFTISDADGWIEQVHVNFSLTPHEGTRNFAITLEEINEINNNYEITASLEITKALDFETITMYTLQMKATDGANNEGSLKTVVEVIDMPDEPPRWSQLTASETIYEKLSHKFSVIAVDGDIQINAEINYKITAEKGEEKFFSVETTVGTITINPIDRDKLQKEVFRFQIIAYEKEDPLSKVEATIIIIVEDVNDNVPQISPENLFINIEEETYVTLNFGQSIIISDPDLAENAQYSICLVDHSKYNWSSAFLIVPNSGYQNGSFTISVINASLLDYEDKQWRNIEIEVQATEVANMSHIGKRSIAINLKNRNDELPIFLNDSVQVDVAEDVPKGFHIATMLATDRDVDDSVTHSLVAQKVLMITKNTGEINTAHDDALDYESIPVVVVQVIATDEANHKTYGSLTINVIDVNDVPPKLYLPKTIPSLTEEMPRNTKVNTTIEARDQDTNASLIFSIDWDSTTAHKSSVIVNESLYRGHLEIQTTYPENGTQYAEGTIVVTGRIDYETFDVIFINIVVTDEKTVHNDNYTSASLTININDINDNFPVFKNIEAMSVNENQLTDTVIGSIFASDDDGPLHNQISYYIEVINNTESGLLQINNKTGVIRVDKDRAIDAEKYEYIYYNVTATDNANNSTLLLAINVIDMNDQIPYLVSDKFNSTIHIQEKSPSGTKILTVYAKDDDRTHPYNNVSYLINTNYSATFQYFNLSRFSGLLQVDLDDDYILDRDFGAATYTLNLKLRDNYLVDGITWNTNAIDTTVTVILDDINDQIPRLPELGDPTAKISETAEKNVLVTIITADDRDDPATNNTKVTYTMLNVSIINREKSGLAEYCKVPFKITTENDKEAHIFTNHDLKGCYGTWAVELYVQDHGTIPGPLNNTKTYNIQITDYNYNDPVITFPIEGKNIALSQDQSLHTQLKTYDKQLLSDFKATDDDYGTSGIVRFTISSEDGDDKYFQIIDTDRNGGQLQLKSWPNFNAKDRFNLVLIATDGGIPARTVSRKLMIIFISTLGPKFDENEWTLWIKENKTGCDYWIQLPEAHDNINEGGTNVVGIYYFIDDKVGDFEFFQLNKTTRNLTLAKELDREMHEIMMILVITTADNDGPPRDPRKEATLSITIMVLDENDNPPIFESLFYSGGVAMEDTVDKIILAVKAIDADINDTLTYSIIDGSLNISDSSLSGISAPFFLDNNSGELALKFSATSNMEGFFTFSILVHDAVGHNSTAVVQIYIISQDNRVVFTFKNDAAYVIQERMFIIQSFSDTFGFLCNVDDIKSSVDATDHVLDNITTLTSHFINPRDHLPIDSDVIILASGDLQTVTNLKAILQTRLLYLIDVPTGSSPVTADIQQTIHWLLVSLTIIFCLCSIALLVAYFIKTKSLSKRLDKMAMEWNFGPHETDLDRAGKVPTTNQFASVGSNPIWNISKQSMTNSEDNVSRASGDSDLIGVENNPDFGYGNLRHILEEQFSQELNAMRRNFPEADETPKIVFSDPFFKEDKYSEDDKKC